MTDLQAALGNLGENLTLDQAQILMSDRLEMRKQCIRVGYCMPDGTDAICSFTFVKGVKDKKFWCLEYKDAMPMKFIADPPSRKHMAELLYESMINNVVPRGEPFDSGVRNTALAILKNPPQLWWM